MVRVRFNEMIHLALAADERLSASFGIAGYGAGDAPASAFVRADAALYRAKEAGRNRVEISRDSDRQGRAPNRRIHAA
jgi:GGDEF domain-containing protein